MIFYVKKPIDDAIKDREISKRINDAYNHFIQKTIESTVNSYGY